MDKGVRGKREGADNREGKPSLREWRVEKRKNGKSKSTTQQNKMLQHHLAKEETDTKSDNDESTIGTTTTKGGK